MEPLRNLGPLDGGRRHFLKAAAAASMACVGWRAAQALAAAEAVAGSTAAPGRRPKSLILLWLDGGPSQLETFDPHPGSATGGPTCGVATSLPGVQLAEGFGRLAELMDSVSLVRSMVGKEGEHVRASYQMKTGYRPNPSVVHPTLGAITAASLPRVDAVGKPLDIPPYVSIQTHDRLARGGYLGDEYNPFRLSDPA
ncbi:MAG: DUF1501 domain-containing protein, partial [Planctomycetia bacterium]